HLLFPSLSSCSVPPPHLHSFPTRRSSDLALYLQLVLGYSPLQVGLAFLPANLIMGALSVAVSARLVMRFGIKRPLAAGLTCAARSEERRVGKECRSGWTQCDQNK